MSDPSSPHKVVTLTTPEASHHAELVRLVQRFVARPSGNLVRDAKALLAKIGGEA